MAMVTSINMVAIKTKHDYWINKCRLYIYTSIFYDKNKSMHNIIYKELEYQDCHSICEINIKFHKTTNTNQLLWLISNKDNSWLAEEYSVWMFLDAIKSSHVELIQTFHSQEIIISCRTYFTEYILEIFYANIVKINLINDIEYTIITKYLEWDFFLDWFLERCEKEKIEYVLNVL